jgi:hypothetical protein
MNKFKTDLLFGLKYEKEALKFLEYETAHFPDPTCKFSEYDLKTFSQKKGYRTYEVKVDRIAWNTGNIAIEYKNGKKESGINTTKAKYYIYFCLHKNLNTYDVYKIRTKKLKKIIEINKPKSINGGDFKKSKMYLINKSLLSKYIIST